MATELLIADADLALCSRYEFIAIRRGFEIRTVASGLECLKLFQAHTPDVLIIDANIPWGASDAVSGQLRQDRTRTRTSEIFITGNQRPEVLSMRFVTPVRRCFQKPVEIDRLFDLITMICPTERKTELLAAPAESSRFSKRNTRYVVSDESSAE